MSPLRITRLPDWPSGTPAPAFAHGMLPLISANAAAIQVGARPTRLPCGFMVEIPEGYEAHVRPRLSLALQSGLILLPSIFTHAHKSEIVVVCYVTGCPDFVVGPGLPLGALAFLPIPASLAVVDALAQRSGEEYPPTPESAGHAGKPGKRK